MKICIIGYGSIGKRHDRILKEYFGIEAQIVRRGDKIPDADIAMICTPTEFHVSYAIECALRDMSLFIEKPLSNSLDGLDELQRIVDEKKLPTYVAYPLRHHWDVLKLANGDRGGLYMRCFTNAKLWPSKRKLDHVLLELSHELDIAYFYDDVLRGDSIRGTMVGDYSFYGSMGRHQISLNMKSGELLWPIREIWDGRYMHYLDTDEDLYARQFEWFLADMDYEMMNNVAEARVLLEKILEFIDE